MSGVNFNTNSVITWLIQKKESLQQNKQLILINEKSLKTDDKLIKWMRDEFKNNLNRNVKFSKFASVCKFISPILFALSTYALRTSHILCNLSLFKDRFLLNNFSLGIGSLLTSVLLGIGYLKFKNSEQALLINVMHINLQQNPASLSNTQMALDEAAAITLLSQGADIQTNPKKVINHFVKNGHSLPVIYIALLEDKVEKRAELLTGTVALTKDPKMLKILFSLGAAQNINELVQLHHVEALRCVIESETNIDHRLAMFQSMLNGTKDQEILNLISELGFENLIQQAIFNNNFQILDQLKIVDPDSEHLKEKLTEALKKTKDFEKLKHLIMLGAKPSENPLLLADYLSDSGELDLALLQFFKDQDTQFNLEILQALTAALTKTKDHGKLEQLIKLGAIPSENPALLAHCLNDNGDLDLVLLQFFKEQGTLFNPEILHALTAALTKTRDHGKLEHLIKLGALPSENPALLAHCLHENGELDLVLLKIFQKQANIRFSIDELFKKASGLVEGCLFNFVSKLEVVLVTIGAGPYHFIPDSFYSSLPSTPERSRSSETCQYSEDEPKTPLRVDRGGDKSPIYVSRQNGTPTIIYPENGSPIILPKTSPKSFTGPDSASKVYTNLNMLDSIKISFNAANLIYQVFLEYRKHNDKFIIERIKSSFETFIKQENSTVST